MGKYETKAIQIELGIIKYMQDYSGKFRHIQNPGIFRTVIHPEPCHIQNQKHIQNSGIFKIRGIFRTP